METQRVAVLGGGIVGLASALALMDRHPRLELHVFEKETEVGRHQTGHNSGVLHAGIYYRPGSLKARLCVEGARLMAAYCERADVPLERVGKLILATTPEELPRLDELERRAQANGVPVRRLSREQIPDVEPEARGLAALHSPDTAILDFAAVARAMRRDLEHRGARMHLGLPVLDLRETQDFVRIRTAQGEFPAEFLLNCGGLHSDRAARMMGLEPEVQILPFRGEYYFLRPEARRLVRGLIYPVPDPGLPFLGVHLTRTIHGSVEAGPNALLAFAREGYRMTDFEPRDLAEALVFPGLWAMGLRLWRTGLYEYRRALSPALFARDLARLVPALRPEDLAPGGAGVRAQAVHRSGALVDDFHFVETRRSLHVLNAPSPAATASLAIGGYVPHRFAALR